MKNFGNVMVIGDSYSTFQDWIPEGFSVYYGIPGRDDLPNVDTVEQTWWHMLVTETGSKLIRNDSWSGSAVCFRTYGQTFSIRSSYIGRVRMLKEQGFFDENKIDTFFIFGGTNDVWAGVPLHEPKYENIEEGDNEFILPAFCTLIKEIKEIFPDCEICVIINCDLNPDFENGVETVAEHYGVKSVRLHDVAKDYGHPNRDGMIAIKNQILQAYAD